MPRLQNLLTRYAGRIGARPLVRPARAAALAAGVSVCLGVVPGPSTQDRQAPDATAGEAGGSQPHLVAGRGADVVREAELRRALAEAEHLAALALSIPSGLPVRQRLTSAWGMREHPVVRGVRPHHGVDLGCPVGTPVLATASGEVLGTGQSRTAGLWVRVGHVGGYSTFYAHLSEARVAKGDRVLEADTLALSGETGRVRGAHLHYELNWGGAGADSLSLPVDALHERRRSATEAAMAALPSRMPGPLHWKAAPPTRAALDHKATAESDD